jgi:hypothetical protein
MRSKGANDNNIKGAMEIKIWQNLLKHSFVI